MNLTSKPTYIYVFALFLLTIGFAVVNFNVPIIGDVWAPRIFGNENSGAFLSIKGYIRGYFNGNPRIGQFWLIFSGYHPHIYAILVSVFATIFIVLLGVIVQGRNWSNNKGLTLASGLITFAFLWFIDREIGPIFFYQATSGNYLFSIIMVLLFLWPFRLFGPENLTPLKLSRSLSILTYGIIALIAGMAHEIYGPSMIVLLSLLLACQKLFLKIKPKVWQCVGVLAYTIGYALIFFAPGQDKRYTDSRYDGIPSSLDALWSKLFQLMDLLIANGLILGAICFIVLIIRLNKISSLKYEYGTVFIAVTLASGFVATAIAAPILGHRLAFASHTFMAIAAAITLLRILGSDLAYKGILGLCLAYLCVEAFRTYNVYDDYKTQFDMQAKAVQEGKESGNLDILAPGYSLHFDEHKKYVFPEFPQKGSKSRVNAFIARYYQVKTFNVSIPQAVIDFSEVFLGEGVTLTADGDCDMNDDKGWTEGDESFGSLVCGRDYSVRYDLEKGAWIVSGPRELNRKEYSIIEASYETVGPNPKTGDMRIWGGAYYFDDRGYVFSARGVKLGHVKKPISGN